MSQLVGPLIFKEITFKHIGEANYLHVMYTLQNSIVHVLLL